MEKVINVYVNDTCGYDISANRNNISKEEIVDNFKRAYEYDGCKKILRSRNESRVKFTIKFDSFKDYNLIIPTSNIEANRKMIKQVNKVYNRMQLKRKELAKARMKKVFLGACIVLAGSFVIEKVPPALQNATEKIVEWDNQQLENEYIESGAKEAHDNLENQKNHEAALEEYYQDKNIEQQQIQQEVNEFEQQQEQLNQQRMLEEIEQYRDLDTMPYVEKVR